ncbi:MAG: cupin domain-containing protein [Acetobacteraceae bacterium]
MARRAGPASTPRRKARATPKKTAARKGAATRKKAAVRKGTVARKAAVARKAPAGRKTSGKAAARGTARAKAAAPKQAPARRTVPKRAAPRKSVPRKAAVTRSARKPEAQPQRFTVSHLREEDFRPDGLRPYARYRDLGIAEATGGLARAHVIRMIPPVTEEVRQRHAHTVDLQLVYVLKGWMKNEFAGHGVQMMEQGSCWLQPPGIAHTVLDYSDDLEVLEIIVPAEFGTHSVA